MIQNNARNNILYNIPQLNIIDVFVDEVVNYNIIKDDINYTDIDITLDYSKGLKLFGNSRWSDIETNRDISTIRQTLITSTIEVKDCKLSFKLSNGMVCVLSIEYHNDSNILENIINDGMFVSTYIKIDLSSNGTEKLFNPKDLVLLKDNIEKIKIMFTGKLELLMNDINSYAGTSTILVKF